MRLSHLTFTGADDAVDPGRLAAWSDASPLIEWGLLLSIEQAGQPRFPSAAWRSESMRSAPEARRAAHLCGAALLESMLDAAAGRALPLAEELRGASAGAPHYGRVQLNFEAHRLPLRVVSGLVADWRQGRWCHADGGVLGLITQHNPSNGELHALFANAGPLGGYPAWYSVLFDASGGFGRVPLAWPPPLAGLHCGYAGGLAPHNLADQLAAIAERLPDDAMIWIDMESGVRTAERFDADKVAAVIDTVKQLAGGAPLVPGVRLDIKARS